MQSHDIYRGYCRSMLFIHLPQRSRNGPKIEILRATMYATPSKNMFGSCFGLISSFYVYQNRRYSWNFESPLKVSTLLAFAELGSAPEGKFFSDLGRSGWSVWPS